MVDTSERMRAERGRPRSGTTQRPDLSAREQILDAAAHLFVERGYAATSTRAIADEVGIRQASLYYHFPSKEQILKVLLMRTVEPSMRVADFLQGAPALPEVRLSALIAFDTDQLLSTAHNVGTLYFLPEIHNELFEPFLVARRTLRDLYAALIVESIAAPTRVELGSARGSRADTSLDYLVDVLFGMVESVIAIRADRPLENTTVLVSTIVRSCLRVLGHNSESIDSITAEAGTLLEEMTSALS